MKILFTVYRCGKNFVEAIQITYGVNNDMDQFTGGLTINFTNINNHGKPEEMFMIKLGNRDMRVQLGDYIIRNLKGDVYPMKPDIFEQMYEKI